jgi:zinc protease
MKCCSAPPVLEAHRSRAIRISFPQIPLPWWLPAGGLGKFSAIDLRKIMTGKNASATPTIGELDEGLAGGSSRKDLETMFQLIYLRFTQPRYDSIAFEAQATQLKSALANQAASPAFAFSAALSKIMSSDSPRVYLPTAELIDKFDPRQVDGVL